ncbi:MAG: hypothetical protein K0Q55_3827, partial [Verrucomicrobia bacterium]|nr:hypothetical protein [Verrucomicrobiota bacterium]
MVGCSDSEPEVPKAPAPVPAPPVEAVPAPTTAAAPATTSTQPPPVAGEVEPELKPIQNAIESFQAQNKRMPLNVDELVSSGALP